MYVIETARVPVWSSYRRARFRNSKHLHASGTPNACTMARTQRRRSSVRTPALSHGACIVTARTPKHSFAAPFVCVLLCNIFRRLALQRSGCGHSSSVLTQDVGRPAVPVIVLCTMARTPTACTYIGTEDVERNSVLCGHGASRGVFGSALHVIETARVPGVVIGHRLACGHVGC